MTKVSKNIDFLTDDYGNLVGSRNPRSATSKDAEFADTHLARLATDTSGNVTVLVAGGGVLRADTGTEFGYKSALAARARSSAPAIDAATASSTKLSVVGGAKGDTLANIEVTITTSAIASPVTIKDGNLPDMAILPSGTAVGVYLVSVGKISVSGGWVVTMPANATGKCFGSFQ